VSVRFHLLRWIAWAWVVATPVAAAADQLVPPVWPQFWPSPAASVPDIDYFMPKPVPAWQIEFAARFWYAAATTGKSLYDPPSISNAMISRLTWSDMSAASGEIFSRASFTNGLFVKGYVGGGGLLGGNLKDEDFPPGIVPYSSTTSSQTGGYLTYASADVGYNVVRGGDFRVGTFVGYHYFDESMNGFGCAQTATNPAVCQPAIPTSIEVISHDNHWQSLRLGLDSSLLIGRFTLSGEAAWLPLVYLNGADSHWLRIGTAVGDFSGPIPETGRGYGYQFEALLSYQVTQYCSVGIGARYWHMQANGTDTESFVGGPSIALPVDWKTDILGAFVQASLKFGPYPIGFIN
jgi:outer membrane protease